MSLSRYRNLNILTGSTGTEYYSTSTFPTKNQLSLVATYSIVVTQFDRLDNLAARYLGSGDYWWVIAVMNNLDWAFAFTPGQTLLIPVDVQDVLKLI